MCTLSWVLHDDGYELLFNRDERLKRGPEVAPTESCADGVPFLAPRDSDAGGTWISVNALGVTVCLLNGYTESRSQRAGEQSRGQLVLDLAPSPSIAALAANLRARDLAPFATFTLAAFAPEGATRALGFVWDGAELEERPLDERDVPVCSSGYDAPKARTERRAELERLKGSAALDGALLKRFHRSHGRGASAYSACMHRDDAATRSLTEIRVDEREIELAYTAGAPCRTRPEPKQRLARLRATDSVDRASCGR